MKNRSHSLEDFECHNGLHKLEVKVPDVTKLPTLREDKFMLEFYNAVSPRQMLAIYASLLKERRIIFTARKLSQLSSCIYAASTLLYPMFWQSIFIPVLPESLRDMIMAPMPFLIGVPKQVMESNVLKDLGEVVIVDLDDRTLQSAHNDVADMPNEVVVYLKHQLKNSMDMDDSISRSFLRANVLLFGGYRMGFVRRESTGVVHWDKQKFVRDQRLSLQPFLSSLIGADGVQYLERFIEERTRALNSGLPISDEFESEIANVDKLKLQVKENASDVIGTLKDKVTGIQISAKLNKLAPKEIRIPKNWTLKKSSKSGGFEPMSFENIQWQEPTAYSDSSRNSSPCPDLSSSVPVANLIDFDTPVNNPDSASGTTTMSDPFMISPATASSSKDTVTAQTAHLTPIPVGRSTFYTTCIDPFLIHSRRQQVLLRKKPLTLAQRSFGMGDEVNSESTSTISDDWVKESDISISSLPMECSKDLLPSSRFVPSVSEIENKKMQWVRLLGVLNRPNPLEDWDQLYNLNSQVVLRNDCRKLATVLGNKKSVPELESFMTLYCKKRNADYKKDIGWLVVLEKFLKFDLPAEHLFNVFFAFTTKYIPKETKENAQIYDLFRLLLQYHDPQISSHLDSLKCSPYSYTNQWFSTVLAASVDDSVCGTLWESYIERGDPFLIFYMALVLIINARDQLLEIDLSRRDIAHGILISLPSQLTVDDVPDFVQLSSYYADRTPQCVREDLHYLIFGANYDDDVSEMQMSKLLCLPLTVQELVRKERGAVGTSNIAYFIIDCRSNEAYKSGHIYGSFNLDCKLIVDEPNQFEMALACLQSYKHDQKFEEHICFFGYGEDDSDQFMNMVIARFLREGTSHVTFAQGGYRGLHNILLESNRLRLINSHDESKCRECRNTSGVSSWKFVGKVKDVVISKSAAVKGKVSGLVIQTTPGHAPTTEVKHVMSSERYGKRYRNERSVFSIEDGSSDEDDGAISNKSGGKEELLITEQAEFIERYPCHEVNENKEMIPSHIAITRTHMHVLRDVPGKPGYVTTEARHALPSVLRVTSRRKVPELLTFKFGYEICGVPKITAVHRFLVPKAGECAKSVKMAIFALRPLSDSETTEIGITTVDDVDKVI
ncbi:hypothetical protein KIN20_024741 [Parelaphostrongylus tenuis]|uniref:TBC1 domain family member 23 n=1 Tax=Parelaphostrongylus tenuis TaxID=148309 RepID=A0AAD5QWX4_PARTN|nr:hypothetical protein KIN20_024741 [Parelaphostrongylus tenuis]